MSQSLVASAAAVAGIVAAVVDGRRSVRVAGLVVALALLPAIGSVAGVPGVLMMLSAGGAAAIAGAASEAAARHLGPASGIDPLVPISSGPDGLFGPRSVRVMGGVLAIVGASWVALNVSVSGAGTATGAVFAAADLWFVGVVRLLRARSIEELATGMVVVALSTAAGWTLEAGPDGLPAAGAAAALAPVTAAVAGWLAGRHHPLRVRTRTP